MDVQLVTNDDYLPSLLLLLTHARTRVDIIAFSFAIGRAGEKAAGRGAPFKIAEALVALKEKYKSKIEIRLYIEGKRETADRNRVSAKYLKKSGLKIKYGSTHAKGFCVDSRYVLFGSTNLTNQSILKNNETNLFIDDRKAAASFTAYFDHVWRGGKHGGIRLNPPFLADGEFKKTILQMIDAAKTRIEFSIYFFDQKEIEEALARAHARGVKITGFVHRHRSFAMSYVRRTVSTIKRLRNEGLDDLHFGPSHLFTHSKFLIKDRREVALGTGNWLNEDVTTHPQLYVHLADARLARQIAKYLSLQIKEQGEN